MWGAVYSIKAIHYATQTKKKDSERTTNTRVCALTRSSERTATVDRATHFEGAEKKPKEATLHATTTVIPHPP